MTALISYMPPTELKEPKAWGIYSAEPRSCQGCISLLPQPTIERALRGGAARHTNNILIPRFSTLLELFPPLFQPSKVSITPF